MSGRPISYAQRYEDLYLMRCFGARSEGFYIDIGSGHPVYDNMSFAFYLQGWRSITVEPNPWLARLSRAVRPRDCHLEALIGAASGEATFYLVEELHGLSTMIESHAHAARTQFGKRSQAMQAPITTLRELCAQHAPAAFDFLKVDVEGAERDVIRNGDWQNHRPKVVIVEALAPFTLAPAWEAWEPILTENCYRYACFDSLNRYYVAEEASELAARLRECTVVIRRRAPVPRRRPRACRHVPSRSRTGDPAARRRHDWPAAARARPALQTADRRHFRCRARENCGPRRDIRRCPAIVRPGCPLYGGRFAAPVRPPPARRLCRDRRERPVPHGLRADFGELCLVGGQHLEALACPAHAALAIRPDGMIAKSCRLSAKIMRPDKYLERNRTTGNSPWVAPAEWAGPREHVMRGALGGPRVLLRRLREVMASRSARRNAWTRSWC